MVENREGEFKGIGSSPNKTLAYSGDKPYSHELPVVTILL